MSEVYFEGDPATDSARRHMERVLKGEQPRRWPWLLAALGSVGVWFILRSNRDSARGRDGGKAKPQEQSAQSGNTREQSRPPDPSFAAGNRPSKKR